VFGAAAPLHKVWFFLDNRKTLLRSISFWISSA
jgi:hypothetical protein